MSLNLYTDHSCRPLIDAQMNLSGRSHYVDQGTLRFFGARILSTHVINNGQLFALVESKRSGFPSDSPREFGFVIFDLFGNAIELPSTGNCYKNRNAATRAMWKAAKTIDADAITKVGFKSERRSFNTQIRQLRRQLRESK